MSDRQAQIRDPKYGLIKFDTLVCEECGDERQKTQIIGWFRLETNSTIDVRAVLGSTLEPLDFCSLTCLGKGVKAMTGE